VALRSSYLALALLGLSACEASVKVNADTASNKAPPPQDQAPEPPPSVDNSPAKASTAFIGVTHAVSLSPDAAKIPTCRCMAVGIGVPSNPAFTWQGAAPSVGDDALVIAISGDGTPCDWNGKNRGPSIQGVDAEGADVIVSIEEGRTGIPLAHGAIIPKPSGDIIFHASRGLPYDDALANSGTGGVCRVRLH
jgi:hypothetical protein